MNTLQMEALVNFGNKKTKNKIKTKTNILFVLYIVKTGYKIQKKKSILNVCLLKNPQIYNNMLFKNMFVLKKKVLSDYLGKKQTKYENNCAKQKNKKKNRKK